MAKIMLVSDFQYNLGIMHISSVLKAHGHICDFIFSTQREEDILHSINEFHPDIIGFSVMTVDQNSTLKLANLLKKNGVAALIIAGGPHPTFFPDFIHNECIDIINRGEGEYSLLELANAVDNHSDIREIQNLYVKKDGKIYKNPLRPLVDMDELPDPDIDLFYKFGVTNYYGRYNFSASRGCPYGCSYCFNHKWNNLYKTGGKQKVIRLKPVEKLINEIEECSKKLDIKLISFVDSTFNLSKKWLLKFLKSYGQRIGIPFSVNLRADLLDEEIVKAIADTNCCYAVRTGLETGSEKLRREVLKKNISNSSFYKMAALLKKYKITFFVYLMFGLPGETVADAYETIEMMQKIQPNLFVAMVFQPYPGMDITNYAIQKGYITEKDLAKLAERKYRWSGILQQPDIKIVMNIHKFCMVLIKFPSLTPVIKKLVRLKPNPIFNLIFDFSLEFNRTGFRSFLYPDQKIIYRITKSSIQMAKSALKARIG